MLNNSLKVVIFDPTAPSLEIWERGFREYEIQSGEDLPDSVKTSVAPSADGNERVRKSLALNAARLPNDSTIREELAQILLVQRQWTDRTSQATPMEASDPNAMPKHA